MVLDEQQKQIYLHYAKFCLPRHTSYPSAPYWNAQLDTASIQSAFRDLAGKDVSLYVHVPFCQQLCFYCACNKLVIPMDSAASPAYTHRYLLGIKREIDRLSQLAKNWQVKQLHLGGGTPTYLPPAAIETIFRWIQAAFGLDAAVEIACEIDPRVTTREHLQLLRTLGVKRLSLGIQDFNPKVQRAINRFQSFELIQQFVYQCRALGFESINFDLIYGLPFQSCESIRDTLSKVIALAPDRIAFYRLALIPNIFRWQRSFLPSDLPEGEEMLAIYLTAINTLQGASYAFIGLDHFAKDTDSLQRAWLEGNLRRNFQGMSSSENLPIIGLGPSAISSLPHHFIQNQSNFRLWEQSTENDWSCEKSVTLSLDDRIRQSVLQELYCYRRIDFERLKREFEIDFYRYFKEEGEALSELEHKGLILCDARQLHVIEPLGQLLVRVVAAVFDRYIPKDAYKRGMSAGSRVG